MRTILVIVATACLLLGCSDPKKASESNFEASIQRYLDAKYPECPISANFPYEDSGSSFSNTPKLFAEMEKLGLLSVTEEVKKPNKYRKPKKIKIYDLTDEGKKYYQPSGVGMKDKVFGGFCFGKADVKEVVEFTEPSDMFGMTVSNAKFIYQVSDIPDWATKNEITSLSRQIKKLVEAQKEPVTDKAELILTNKGWKHHRQDKLDERRKKLEKLKLE